MSSGLPWSLLGIPATGDVKAIRKAYADRIKAMDLDADVAGYAALRDARDAALQIARRKEPAPGTRSADQPGAAGVLEGNAAEPLAGEKRTAWLHAAPDLPGAWQSDAALAIVPGEPPADFHGIPARARSDPGALAAPPSADRTIPLPAGDPFAPPYLPGHDDKASLGLTPGQTAFDRLAAILLPVGTDEGAPMADDEADEAMRRLQAVLDEAAVSDIGTHHRIENWLAGLLAQAWPRSAPLLEDATVAFGWEREWRKVDARPEVEYLGARLRGYRFQQQVPQDPGHRFHAAWKELSRPGRAGPFKFLRVSRAQVEALLSGIRKHFPEVEGHLDEQRVASWERGGTISPMTAAYLIIFGLIALGAFVRSFDGSPPPAAAPPIVAERGFEEPDSASVTAAVEAAVAEIFGEEHDSNWLWMRQPDLAQTITANARYALLQGEDGEAVIRKATEIVRERVYREGRQLDGADFDTAMRLRLGQLRAARAAGVPACVELLGSSWLDAAVPVPASLRAQERRFAAALAEKGLLKAPEPREGTSASVPGELVGRVIEATGLSEAQVGAAMQGKGSGANRCAVAIALLDATLAWRGKGRRAILMTL